MLEDEACVAEFVSPVRAVGQVDGPRRDLSGKAQEIKGHRSAGLNAPSKFTCKGTSDLIDIRTQLLSQKLTEAGIVRDSTYDAPNLAFLGQTMQCGIDGWPSSEVAKSFGEKAQPPLFLSPCKLFFLQ